MEGNMEEKKNRTESAAGDVKGNTGAEVTTARALAPGARFWDWTEEGEGEARTLRLEGPIDEDDFWGDAVTPQVFREELYADQGDVTVWINSPGGSVFAAAEIYTMLRDYPGKVTVRIASLAASAASVVAMAGDVVEVSPTALIMIHDPATIAVGNIRDMERTIEALSEVKESIINAYMAKTGLSHGRISRLMENESWLNAKKAVELGFADVILFVDKDAAPSDEDGDGEGPDISTPVDIAGKPVLYSTRQMDLTIMDRLRYEVMDRTAGGGSRGTGPDAADTADPASTDGAGKGEKGGEGDDERTDERVDERTDEGAVDGAVRECGYRELGVVCTNQYHNKIPMGFNEL